MKYLLPILLILISLFTPLTVHAQDTTPSVFFCVGNNPQPPCVTPVPSVSPSQAVSPSVNPSVSPQTSTAPSMSPAPSAISPSPSTNPCVSQNSITSIKAKKHMHGAKGIPQQLMQLILQLLQLLFQLLGIHLPTPTPTPTPTPSVSPSGTPSSAPSVSPTTNPCPSTAPSVSVSPSGVSQAPSSAPSPSILPTPTIFGTSPTPSPSPSPSTATSPSPSTSPSVSATPTPKPVKTGLLVSNVTAGTKATSKLCADDKGNSTTNGNPVVTWNCNNKDKAQIWTQESDGTIRINGKCLDVTAKKTTNNSTVGISTCNGQTNQKWTLKPITSGTAKGKTELLGTQSNKCLDVKGSSITQGTQLEIFTCNGGNNQAWSWDTGTTTPKQTHAGLLQVNLFAGKSKTQKLCLDDKGNGTADNNPAVTWACDASDKAQKWTAYNDNTIQHNGKCLDVNKHGTADRTPVDLFTCNGGKNQQWTLTTFKGKPVLKGVQSGKCLDVKGSSTANGTPLEIFTCSGNANQQWSWH